MSSGSHHVASARRPVLMQVSQRAVSEESGTAPGSASFEMLDSKGLGAKWGLFPSWIERRSQPGVSDPIPHYRFGRYVRYKWPSAELLAWFERQKG
jgi:hypothetical protein